MRADGAAIGSLGVCTFRPFPHAAVRVALGDARRIVVLEKNLSVGMGGVLATDVRTALEGQASAVHTVVAGLGGRAITRRSVRRVLEQAHGGELPSLHFLDVDRTVIERERTRGREERSA